MVSATDIQLYTVNVRLRSPLSFPISLSILLFLYIGLLDFLLLARVYVIAVLFITRATLASAGISCHRVSVRPSVCHKSVFY